MENTLNTIEFANAMMSAVEDFDDLLELQAETGLNYEELENMYYNN